MGERTAWRVLIDLSPLGRSRDLRCLVLGEVVSALGTQLTTVAVPYQVYQLTRSSLYVGLVSLAQLFPLIAGSLLSGSVVDAMDRRRLLIATQVLRSEVPTANAIFQALFQFGLVAGPALAGLLLAGTGVWFVHWLDVASFGAASATAFLISPQPPAGAADRRPGLRSIAEGLAFVRGRVEVAGIEPASFSASPGLLRAQLALLFSAPAITQARRRQAQPLFDVPPGPAAGSGGDPSS